MNNPNFFNDALRTIFSWLDSLGYFLLDAVYDIFFTVANANIFQGVTINEFYTRVQLIFGVFMIFKLSITLLQMIINPDMFKDKQKGASSLVTRIAVILVLLTLIVPIEGISNTENSLNEQISSNGILFGFLYQIQNTVIKDQVLTKLVLGYGGDSTDAEPGNMSDVGSHLAATVAQAFIRPTLSSGANDDEITALTEDDGDNSYESNVACNGGEADAYFNGDLTAGTLIDHINDTCDSDNDGEVYVFDYTILGGLLCSIIMVLIILGFTIDVAVRAVKLAILRLIAPIPIISYIDPSQGKDGAFNNWVKTLTSTYLSLFLRLIIIYFGAYLIILLTDSNDNFSIIQSGTSVSTSFFATIFIIIGILMFMKDAPKFFQDMLGIKGDGKLFSGIGTILGAAALTGGLVGSVATGARAGWEEGQEFRDGSKSKFGAGVRGALSAGRAAFSGLAGGIGGAYAGGRAFMTADKNRPGAVYSAMQRNMTRRAAHSTVFGRGVDKVSSALTGTSPVDRMDAQIAAYTDFSDLYKQVAAKADVDDVFQYTYTDSSGRTITSNVKALKENLERLKVSGASVADLTEAENTYKAAQENLISSVMNGTYKNHTVRKEESSFSTQIRQDYNTAMQTIRSNNLDLREINNAKDFKIASFDAVDKARNMKHSAGYKARKANQQYSKK